MIREAHHEPEQPLRCETHMEGHALFQFNLVLDALFSQRMQRVYDLFCKRKTPSTWKWIVSLFQKRQRDFGPMMAELVNEACEEAIRIVARTHLYHELRKLHESGHLNDLVKKQLRQPGALLVREGVLRVSPDLPAEDLIHEVKVEIVKLYEVQGESPTSTSSAT